MSGFGFRVRQYRVDAEGDYSLYSEWDDTYAPADRWHVDLPHQCDGWTIAGGDYGSDAPTHAEAVADLEAFIAEAQAALVALRERREVGGSL